MKIIAVIGKANTGKSQSVMDAGIHILAIHLGVGPLSRYDFAKYCDANVEPVPGRVKGRTVDAACIVAIGSIRIGIESQGDPTGGTLRLTEISLPLFAEQQCQLVVCAARTPRPFDKVRMLAAQYGYAVEQIGKTKLPRHEREADNDSTVQQILQYVATVIEQMGQA